MKFSSKRIQREADTIFIMIKMYCKDHHAPKSELCRDCETLLEYAYKRLLHCPFQENKSSCGKCTIHCYKPAYREQIKQVMRYVGPRMVFPHPVLSFLHFVDGLRKTRKL
ncbi:MAG: nitrous oxide-stimulated promoter family protein [Desulfobulbaceae bacterium]|nr:nitrous oxide-stimulated promoter family protein [Desulfobulbaceae bacterium]